MQDVDVTPVLGSGDVGEAAWVEVLWIDVDFDGGAFADLFPNQRYVMVGLYGVGVLITDIQGSGR